MTALFHSTFNGAATEPDASAKVVTDNAAAFDFIFGCLLEGYYTVYYFMSPPNSVQRYDFTGLTPNDYMDMDLSSIFGLNSRFGAVLGVIWRFFAH